MHDELAAQDLDNLRRKLLSSRTGRAHKILRMERITGRIHLACVGKGYWVSLWLRDAAGGSLSTYCKNCAIQQFVHQRNRATSSVVCLLHAIAKVRNNRHTRVPAERCKSVAIPACGCCLPFARGSLSSWRQLEDCRTVLEKAELFCSWIAGNTGMAGTAFGSVDSRGLPLSLDRETPLQTSEL